jgi:hypothetical protein
MNKLITSIIASLVLATSASAGVGESPAVSLADWRKSGITPQGWETVEGWPCLVGQTSDGIIAIHVFTMDRKYNIACILVGAPVTQDMIDMLKQNAPGKTWELAYKDEEAVVWRSSFKSNGYEYYRNIVASYRWIAITNQRGFEYLSVAASRLQGNNELFALKQPLAPALKPGPLAPKPAVPTATPADQNDCLPFALEALKRLKKSSHWAEIAGFTWIENGKRIGGHAVVFYQPTEKTNVFMYDRSGSFDLQTRSHDLGEIIDALNQLTRDNLRVESPRWLENDDSRKEFASSKSDRQPVWSSTGTTTPEQIGELIGRLTFAMLVLAGYAWIIVICFLKGKGGFAVLGIFGLFIPFLSWAAIIGAIRIAKPHSRWARKRYGPEKMSIALQRFMPLCQEAL